MKQKTLHTLVCSFLWWLGMAIFTPLTAQEVSSFFDELNTRLAAKEYLKVAGSTQLNLRWNHISGIAARTDPFTARLNAALLVDFLGLKGPFSVAFSDGNRSYNLPAYAFYGFSPSYKWIQLHIGDRSMNFSPYSLSGHNFRGFGMELRPGKFYLGLMSGRLLRAQLADAGAIQNLDPVFRRFGRGLKLGFDNGSDKLSAILFHASDQATSVPFSDSSRVRPQDNVVVELQGRKVLSTLFDISFDLAHSALTRDKTAPRLQNPGKGFNGSLLGLFTPHSSTAYGQAWNFEIGFSPSFANFTLGIERIGTGYQSLGRLAFLNDTENIKLGSSTTLFKKKMTLSAAIGVQRNGLSDIGITDGSRLIGSANASLAVSKRLNTNLSLSNMNYTMRQRVNTVPFVVVDSIVIVQSNLNTTLGINYLVGEKMQSVASFSLAYQNASAITNEEVDVQNANSFYAGVLSYTWSLPEQNWTFTASCLTNITQIAIGNTTIISPSISIQKSLLDERLRLDGGLGYSHVQTRNNQISRILEGRMGLQWKVSDKHSLRTQFSYVENSSNATDLGFMPFSDFNGQLGYNFTF